MPRIKMKPERRSNANGVLWEVLTLAEAAAYLRLPEGEVLRMVREQGLHAREVGAEWRFLKTAIDDWLRSGPPPSSNKGAWMALAGVWKDDPYVEDELKETYRRRGRPRAALAWRLEARLERAGARGADARLGRARVALSGRPGSSTPGDPRPRLPRGALAALPAGDVVCRRSPAAATRGREDRMHVDPRDRSG